MSRSRSFKVEEDVSMTEKTEEKSLLREVWDALSFSEIRTAMRVALKHMFVKPVTFQYPREKRTIPDAHRGAPGLLRSDDDTESLQYRYKFPHQDAGLTPPQDS